MKVRGDFLGPPQSTDKTTRKIKVRKLAKIKANYKWYQLYKYEYLPINGLLDIYISQKKRIALFKGLLDFDLQPHLRQELWGLDSGVIM